MKNLRNIFALGKRLKVLLVSETKAPKANSTTPLNAAIDPASRPVETYYIASPLEKEMVVTFRED